MEESVLVEKEGKLSLAPLFDVKLLQDTLKLEIENARSVTPTPENAELCAKQVTKLNKTVKDWKAKLAQAEEPYLSAIEAVVKPITDVLEAFAEDAKAYQSDVLGAKKQARFDKAKGIYSKVLGAMLQDGSLDGQAPKFEEVYLPSYYNLTDDALEAVLKQNIVDTLKRQSAEGKVATFVFEGEKIAQAEKLLTDHGWVKDKDFNEEIL